MVRAAALTLLLVGDAPVRADSSVPVDAAKKISWGQQCKARFEQARDESAQLGFTAGKVEVVLREEVLPLVEDFWFGWTHGKTSFSVAVAPQTDQEFKAQFKRDSGPGWHESGPNDEHRHAAGHTATIVTRLSADSERVSALRALWRRAADDCLQTGEPLPSASSPWGRACVARFAQARAETAAIDGRFAGGELDVSKEGGAERVNFVGPRLDQTRAPEWSVVVHPESDAEFRASLEKGFRWEHKADASGWMFVPNHPNHSYPPSHYTLHRGARTADLYLEWNDKSLTDRLMTVWQRAAADCLESK